MRFFLFLLAALACLGCPKEKEIQSAGDIPQEESAPYATVGPGDLLSVRVVGESELTGEYRVSSDGTITFPWLQKISVGGLMLGEIQDKIVVGLKNGYLRDPQVIVDVKEANSQKVYVYGQIKSPGTYRYKDHMTVVEIVTLAGGLTADADPNKAYVTRNINGKETVYTVRINDIVTGKARNEELNPGDILYVPLRYAF